MRRKIVWGSIGILLLCSFVVLTAWAQENRDDVGDLPEGFFRIRVQNGSFNLGAGKTFDIFWNQPGEDDPTDDSVWIFNPYIGQLTIFFPYEAYGEGFVFNAFADMNNDGRFSDDEWFIRDRAVTDYPYQDGRLWISFDPFPCPIGTAFRIVLSSTLIGNVLGENDISSITELILAHGEEVEDYYLTQEMLFGPSYTSRRSFPPTLPPSEDENGNGDDGEDNGKPEKPEKPEKPQRGNNGVGNGEDPQPPGNPPINDGEGSGKGNPGNRKKDKE